MLTYYYDEQSENNNSTQNVTSTQTSLQSEPDLAAMDRAYNPALIHHLYLGLGHMGKVKRFPDLKIKHSDLQNPGYPTSIILFFIFTLVVVMSMIILLIVMVSVSFSSTEENLISNMEEQGPGRDPDQQVREKS